MDALGQAAVLLVGPNLHIPPLLVGALYVEKFIYRSITNVVNVREGEEGPVDDRVILNMVFTIPSRTVPTELQIEGIDQERGRGPLFKAFYRLPV
jgi:hypothetical protein